MTVHASKGLEFKQVFIVGVEEDLFPSAKSKNSEREIEEERRLLYVAITRAEENCTLTYPSPAIEWKSVPRYGFSGRLLFGLYRHIDVSRIEVFDEPAWRGGDRLSVTIAGEGIREGAVFFCADRKSVV